MTFESTCHVQFVDYSAFFHIFNWIAQKVALSFRELFWKGQQNSPPLALLLKQWTLPTHQNCWLFVYQYVMATTQGITSGLKMYRLFTPVVFVGWQITECVLFVCNKDGDTIAFWELTPALCVLIGVQFDGIYELLHTAGIKSLGSYWICFHFVIGSFGFICGGTYEHMKKEPASLISINFSEETFE